MTTDKVQRSPGRPKKTEKLTDTLPRVRVSRDLIEAIDTQSRDRNMGSVSSYVRLTLILDVLRKGDRLEVEYLHDDPKSKTKVLGIVKSINKNELTIKPTKSGRGYKLTHINKESDRLKIKLTKILNIGYFKRSNEIG